MARYKKTYSSFSDLGRDMGIKPPSRENKNFDSKHNEQNNFVLPKDTRDNVNSVFSVDNFALRLNKFIPWERDNKPRKLLTTDRRTKEPVYFVAKDISTYHEKFDQSLWYKFEYSEIIDDYYTTVRSLPYDFIKEELVLSTAWRLIVGLGHESVYETSITLHHVYGIPYIPASAIKGVLRSYIIQEKFDNDENSAMEDNSFINIFGSQDQEGNIIFFDAFPDEAPSIEPDVMNVHYPNYYSGEEPPTDYQNPNPIYFLTVRGKFKFVIAARKGKLVNYIIPQPDDYQPQEGNNYDSGTIMWWLKEALETRGIGAKTAVGYGRMKQE